MGMLKEPHSLYPITYESVFHAIVRTIDNNN